MENVILRPKEQARLQVLNSLHAEQITLYQAAELMGVTTGHARRILEAYRRNGAAALAHGLRGVKSANAVPEATKSRVVHLAGTIYHHANHTHLSELLSEREGIDMGGPPCGASWSTQVWQAREAGVRPSTGCAGSECPGKAC